MARSCADGDRAIVACAHLAALYQRVAIDRLHAEVLALPLATEKKRLDPRIAAYISYYDILGMG